MNDREVSLRSVIAYSLWLIGATLATLEMFGQWNAGELGVVAAAIGATLNVRGFFIDLHRRERRAFDFGREYEQTRVRRLT